MNLNATIQTLRTVTWVLKKEKAVIPDFDGWYEEWERRLRSDATMRWLVESRNKIEKQGDLETNSTAVVSLLAGWHDPVPLCEAVVSPLMTPADIVRHLPELTLPGSESTMRRHGILLIERRWVQKEMPGSELLELLAYCYGILATVVVDAHKRCGVTMRTFRRDFHGSRPVRTDHLDGRLPCMVATRSTRTGALHLDTGQLVSFSRHSMRADPAIKDEVLGRYGSREGELALQPGEDLIDASLRHFEMAKKVLVVDGFHLPTIHLRKPDGQREVQMLAHDDRQALYLMMREIADQVEQSGAVGVVHTTECWMAAVDELRPEQMPSDVPNRREVLQVTAATSDGRHRVHWVEFTKNAEGRIELGAGSSLDESNNWWGFLQPIQDVWRKWPEWQTGRGAPLPQSNP